MVSFVCWCNAFLRVLQSTFFFVIFIGLPFAGRFILYWHYYCYHNVPSDDFIFNPLEIHWTFFLSIALLKIWRAFKSIKTAHFTIQCISRCVFISPNLYFCGPTTTIRVYTYKYNFVRNLILISTLFITMENHAKSRPIHSFGFQHHHRHHR